MPKRRCIHSSAAPEPIGPYCQGNIAGPFLLTAMTGGIDPSTGSLPEGGVEPEARQAIKNLQAILSAGDCRLEDVAKVTVYLSDLKDFQRVNEIYAEFFSQPYPARSIMQTLLPGGFKVAFDAMALRPTPSS